jgi:hypothetical protein
VTYTIATNTSTFSRSSSIFIGGQPLTVMQAAPAKPVAPANLVIKK